MARSSGRVSDRLPHASRFSRRGAFPRLPQTNSRLQPCWMYTTTGTALAWQGTLCTGTASTANIMDRKYNFNLGRLVHAISGRCVPLVSWIFGRIISLGELVRVPARFEFDCDPIHSDGGDTHSFAKYANEWGTRRQGPTPPDSFGCLLEVNGEYFDCRLFLKDIGSLYAGQTAPPKAPALTALNPMRTFAQLNFTRAPAPRVQRLLNSAPSQRPAPSNPANLTFTHSLTHSLTHMFTL